MVKISRHLFLILLMMSLILISISGCASRPGAPTILTLWHNYGGQLKETMDCLLYTSIGAPPTMILKFSR